jgi:hypothetical protein
MRSDRFRSSALIAITALLTASSGLAHAGDPADTAD